MKLTVQGFPAYAFTGGRPFDPARPAVVLLHGAALDHSSWQWQSRHLAHRGYGVLAVDLPGHGRSAGPALPSVEALANWVAGLLDRAGVGPAHLAGHSLGALVALETALAHPDRVASLALLGASVPMPVGEAFLAAARDDSPAALDMQSTWGHARHSLLATSAVPGLSLLRAGRRLNERAGPGVQAAGLAACNAYAPPEERLRSLATRTLAIGGRRDQMTPLAATRALAARLPGARFVVVEAGHSMTDEAPREVAAALREHLAG